MSTADTHWEHMDRLIEAKTCLIVDFIPYAPIGTTFSPLETYMEERYRPIHAEKMVMLLLLLAYRYPNSAIYVDDDSGFFYEDHPELYHDNHDDRPTNIDVRHFAPEKIASYIREIVADERHVLFSVYIPGIDCLMRLTGGFSNEIFGDDQEFLDLVHALAAQQGLFIREVSNDF